MIVQKLIGLEWHDGWMASILHLNDDRVFAAVAVAVDWDQRRSLFALCPITNDQASRLARLHAANGFSPECNQIWLEALSRSPVHLVEKEPTEGAPLDFSEATIAQRQRVAGYKLPLVEIASSPEALRFWFDDTPSTPDSERPPLRG